MNNVYIAPSVLSADFTRLAHELESIKSADYIHYDVMDGHFVPNISFGPAIMKEAQKATRLPFDVHLMVTNPAEIIPLFLDLGADTSLPFIWRQRLTPIDLCILYAPPVLRQVLPSTRQRRSVFWKTSSKTLIWYSL